MGDDFFKSFEARISGWRKGSWLKRKKSVEPYLGIFCVHERTLPCSAGRDLKAVILGIGAGLSSERSDGARELMVGDGLDKTRNLVLEARGHAKPERVRDYWKGRCGVEEEWKIMDCSRGVFAPRKRGAM